jgi:trigger factor
VNLLKAVEDINTTKKRLKIEIPADVVEAEIRNSLEMLRQQAKIPGFRPGKAPISLIEKRFGKNVEAEVLEKIIPEQLSSAIKEAALNPVTMPELEEEIQFKRNNPINLSVTVEVVPEIGEIDYEGLTVKDIAAEVQESEIEDTLKKLQDQKAVYEVGDKEIEMDDFVSFEYVDSEIVGEDLPSAKDLISKMGNEIFPPDLTEKVLGKKKGDIFEFSATFDESKPKELAGKTANIKVRISEVKRKNLPAIDDDFAKDLGVENVGELRDKLREKIYTVKKEQVRKMQKAQILNRLIESNAFEVPEVLLQRELDALAMQKNVDPREDTGPDDSVPGKPDVAPDTDKPDQGKEGDPHVKMRERALRKVRASVIIDEIGKKEGVAVSDEEVNERIASVAKRLSATPEAVRNFYEYRGGSIESLKHSIFEDKVMDMLLSKAVVEKENK